MLEIYNDSLNDLLAKSSGATLEIRVQGKSVSVPGLTQVQVQTEADILNVMETGEKNRKIASTKMNIQRWVKTIECIEEMDVTSVMSPIGLWTVAWKSIVSNLSSAMGAMGGAGRLLWLRGLDLEDIEQSTCQSGRSHALMHTLLYRHI